MVRNIIIVILIVILAVLIYRLFFDNPPLSGIKVNIKGKNYQLEIAKTARQQITGLMNRPSLCANCGMVFVFNIQLPQVFWMKDTLIPLDMIFLDHNGTVLNIATAVPQPGVPDNQLTLYRSAGAAKYVIELNAGDADKLSLKAGNIIDIPPL